MKTLFLAFCLLPALAAGQPVPEKRAALDKLLDALGTAPDEQAAARLEAKIEQSWLRSSTPAVTLLMDRGLHEMQGNAPAEAFMVFSDALVLDPTMAEAWHQRGVARIQVGDLPGALRDIQQALTLEPRHFGAWKTLVVIAERREDWKTAHDAWTHVLEIDPRTPKGEEVLKDLKRKAFGDDT